MDRLEQMERARARARGVRVVKLAGQDRYMARSRAYEPGSYFALWVSPWGHVRCVCRGFTYRGVCRHAEALRAILKARLPGARSTGGQHWLGVQSGGFALTAVAVLGDGFLNEAISAGAPRK